jgi:hypothetical protein
MRKCYCFDSDVRRKRCKMPYLRKERKLRELRCTDDQENNQTCLCGLSNVLHLMFAESHNPRSENHFAAN